MAIPEHQNLADIVNNPPAKATAENLQRLRENIAGLRKTSQESGQKVIIDGQLKTLYQNIAKHVSDESLSVEVRQEYAKLRDEMTRTIPLEQLATSPGDAIARIELFVRENVGDVLGGVRENTGDIIGRAQTFLSENPRISTAMTVAGTGAALSVLRHPWEALSSPWQTTKTLARAIMRGAMGAAVAAGATYAYSFLPESFRKGVRDTFHNMGERARSVFDQYIHPRLPMWMQDLIPPSRRTIRPSEDQIKTVIQNREKQQKMTDEAIELVDPESGSAPAAAKYAIEQISLEIWLIQSLPEDLWDQGALKSRLAFLNTERERMTRLIPQDIIKKIEADGKTKLQQDRKQEIQFPPPVQNFIKRNSELLASSQKQIDAFRSNPTAEGYENAFFAINEQRGNLRNIDQTLTGVSAEIATAARAIATRGLEDIATRERGLEQSAIGTSAEARARELREAIQTTSDVLTGTGLPANQDITSMTLNGVGIVLQNGSLRLDGKEISITGDGMTVSVNRIRKSNGGLRCEATAVGGIIDANFELSPQDVVRLTRIYLQRRNRPVTQPGFSLDRRPFIQLDDRTISISGTNRRIRVYLYP